ncbi:MAG: homoserine O-acetyltransferase, partial [Cytophagaceae bacterium]
IKAKSLLIGILTDVLFPVEEQIFLSKHIPGASYQQIDSLFGHDGFLIETTLIEAGIRAFYKAHEKVIL